MKNEHAQNMNISKPSKETLMQIDLGELHKLTRSGRSVEFLNAEPGKEHYRLLAWFSQQFDKEELTEVGTLDGCGALALSYNQKNKVTTWDVRFYDDACEFPQNVHSRIVDAGNQYMNKVVRSKVIFYDTMHDGTLEIEFLNMLIAAKWQGILILDDIYLNEPMKAFWNAITIRKEDWSDVGHWSGTGIVFFD